jgi:tol-pal system protein YbgF
MKLAKIAALALVCAAPLGCATVAEQRKLEYEVNKIRTANGAGDPGKRIAEISAELDALRSEVADLRGRLELAEHAVQQATEDAHAAREASAAQAAPTPSPESEETADSGDAAELSLYKEGFDAWRGNDHATCIDRFGRFLQTYPSSKLADDAAYWWADCHYKAGELQKAVLRFDEVATRYPKSEKAPEALFREGETLLQLGPRFSKAAKQAFQRLIDTYPDHKRAQEAKDRLAIIGG